MAVRIDQLPSLHASMSQYLAVIFDEQVFVKNVTFRSKTFKKVTLTH